MTSRYDGALLEVLNWDKYNPRKDLKATSWLRLQNSLFEDPNFIDFTHSELIAWIYILSLCSKKQSGKIQLVLAHADRIGRLKSSDVESAIEKLQQLQCVTVTLRARDVHVTRTLRARTTTNVTNVTNVTNETGRDAGVTCTLRGRDVEDPPAVGTPKAVPPTQLFVARYVTAFQERYGKNARPNLAGKVQGQIKRFLEETPIERACEMIQVYCQMNDQWFITKAHDFGTFIENLSKVGLALDTGQVTTRREAQAAEQGDFYRNQMGRIMRGEV